MFFSGYLSYIHEVYILINFCAFSLNFFLINKGVSAKASVVAQMVKNLFVMQEIWAQILGWEDPLVKGMATHSSILAGRIPWTEEPGGLQSTGSQRVRQDWATNIYLAKNPKG